MIEKQELHCHNCDRYVRFNLDLSIDGNYKLECPNCGHLHYRIVKDGKITELRWGRDPNQVDWSVVQSTSFSNKSFTSTSSSTSYYLINSWASTTGSWT